MINYRRFFDVNTLIGLRTENKSVFDNTHVANFRFDRTKKNSGFKN